MGENLTECDNIKEMREQMQWNFYFFLRKQLQQQTQKNENKVNSIRTFDKSNQMREMLQQLNRYRCNRTQTGKRFDAIEQKDRYKLRDEDKYEKKNRQKCMEFCKNSLKIEQIYEKY